MINFSLIAWSIAGGVLPALLWVMFWQSEDSKRPEPRSLLVRTLLLGMLSVPFVVPFMEVLGVAPSNAPLIAIVFWAILEEVFKLGAAYLGGISTVYDDEPIDPLIYMITAALGYVAAENTLFILKALSEQGAIYGIVTGGYRFVGASLLHVVTSGTIGLALAVTFYNPLHTKIVATILGFTTAVFLHVIFNLFVENKGNLSTFITFGMLWSAVALLIWFMDIVKRIRPLPNKNSSL
jgi:RsiW-degrading membrane proteinase PrsW (M82 family)